jgi:hypothetical protein
MACDCARHRERRGERRLARGGLRIGRDPRDLIAQVEAAGEPDIAQRQVRVGLQHALHDPGLPVLDRNAQPLLPGGSVHAMGLHRELQMRPRSEPVLQRDDMEIIGVLQRRALGPRAVVVHAHPRGAVAGLKGFLQRLGVTAQLVDGFGHVGSLIDRPAGPLRSGMRDTEMMSSSDVRGVPMTAVRGPGCRPRGGVQNTTTGVPALEDSVEQASSQGS